MRRTASTSLRSLSVSLPFRALPTDTKPRSRWWLPWSLDCNDVLSAFADSQCSTMYCRSAPIDPESVPRVVQPFVSEFDLGSASCRSNSHSW